jgi:YaiO family outer membrane protein
MFQDDGVVAAAVVTVDLRCARYAAGNIETANPGVEFYLAQGLGWITARHINIWDETGRHHTGFFVRADFQPVETLTLFAGYADAPDTSEGVVLPTTAWFAGVATDVDEATTIRLSLGQELHETGYDRTTVTLSLTLKR